MSALPSAKLWLMHATGLSKDALHVYVGLALFLGTALALRRGIRSWKPWAVVAVAALAGEAWDLRDSIAQQTAIDLAGNWKDVWNTLFWPSVLLFLARAGWLPGRRR